VVSVSPTFLDEMFGMQMLHCYAVLPKNGGQDFGSITVTLAVADEPFLAQVNRTALICSLEEYFGRVQIFGNALAFAKYCDKQWPAEQFNKVVSTIMRERGLN
jgi:hypothetical protein